MAHFADGDDELRSAHNGGWYHNGLETRRFSGPLHVEWSHVTAQMYHHTWHLLEEPGP